MSLGAGAFKVSWGPNAISREEKSMATLEAGTTPRAATNRHSHTEQNQWRYLPKRILIWEMIMKPLGREEREQESAVIRKKAKIDPLWSASKATMQHNTSKRAHKEPCNSPRAAP